jgi:hypothetical protein
LSDDILTVTLSETDSHGHLQLNLRVVESDGDYMIFGHTVVPTVFPGLATMTLYKSGFEYRAVSGAWIP